MPAGDLILNDAEAFEKLRSIGQMHLLKYWDHLSLSERKSLREQVSLLDLDMLQLQRQELFSTEKFLPPFSPFKNNFIADTPRDFDIGIALAKEGKCACLVLAGGQGSRLHCHGPKGTISISNIKQKSLFQLIAEKVKVASDQVGNDLPIAFMTSPLNHLETQAFFVQHAFFGLKPEQVFFFHQTMWPLLDFEGNLFLESPFQIALGPNGNGGIFRHCVQSGLWDRWNEMGVEGVSLIPVDNPLALPFDYELMGFHALHGNAITIKAAYKEKAQEEVGILVDSNGKTMVIEYTELPEKERVAFANDGRLKHRVANIGLFSFSMSFIKKASHLTLPLHKAKKRVKQLGEDGKTTFPKESNCWKFEEYIFDTFPYADRCEALIYPRDICFAPLKNLNGEDSIESVRSALLASDQRMFFSITGVKAPSQKVFELAPEFYYPTKSLMQKWRGKTLPDQPYIEA